MAKKVYHKKPATGNIPQQEGVENWKSLSKQANIKIEESLKNFSKLSNKQREDLFWNKDFLDQFWDFFKDEHPNLLDEIDSQEKLTIYVQNLEKKWFSLENIINNTQELHEEFKETKDEKQVITQSLKELEEYCKKSENKMPAHIFQSFANDIKLGISPITITKNTKINKLGNLLSVRTHYLEDNGIVLKDHQKTQVEKILQPGYLPTERLLISATIKKIKRNLPDNLLSDFEADFPLPIDIHSPFENLKNLQQQRRIFLDSHKSQIDENLARKLDKIIITNGDIYQELQYEGETIERTKGFSEQTKNFRRMFNKLATRQLFEEAKETGTYVAHHLEEIGKEFKNFPPYINELLHIYPYKQQTVIDQQPVHKATYEKQAQLLSETEKEFEKQGLSEQQKEDLRKKIFDIQKDLNEIKRNAYADYIHSKNAEIGTIIKQLIQNNFDIKKLAINDQQKLVNTLVSSKLDDSVKNQIPKILGIDAKEYESFVKKLFDLKEKDIEIPTQYGNIPLHFLEKSFLWGPAKDFMEITTNGEILSDQKNLPLNFKVQVTEQNKAFFEDNILFEDLYFDVNSKNNGTITLNDSYKVRIINNQGKQVEWYLSEYAPTEEIELAVKEGKSVKKGLFLYSHPITRPEDAREVITWDGNTKGDPVVIEKDDEKNYTIDILSKEINLNGEAISALLFSYPLGQYNINNNLSKEQEKKLAEKFGKINKESIYKDTLDQHDEEKTDQKKENTSEEKKESIKKKEKEAFLEERKNIKWFQEEEIEGEKTYGFKKGAKLLIKWPESSFLPSGSFQYITAEITEVDEEKGTFTMKFYGNEQSLGQRQNKDKKFSLTKKGLEGFKNIFEDNVYKLPKEENENTLHSFILSLEEAWIDDIKPSHSFKETDRTGNNFMINFGKEKGEIVTHFWLVETLPGDDPGKESTKGYMYEIHHEPLKKKFKIIANDEKKTTLHLDYPNFILFIASRKLQPQTEKTAKGISVNAQSWTQVEEPKKRKGYSFASIIGLVKNFGKKIGDGLKKYEDDQTEDLTDKIFYHGKFFYWLAKIMPTTKLQEAFENAGHEYRTDRDNKVYKKIEKYLAFYEKDPDFGSDTSWKEQVEPYIRGEKKFKDHHQAAAMLIATMKKGKGPYSRNTDRAGKGLRVNLLLGPEHQKRYILIKEKLERELQQGYKIHGQNWADDRQNEILKLEMKYIIDSIDGRHMQYRPDTPKFEAMYSKKFACDMLETESNKFFDETVKSSTKEKNYSFELARFEYYRLLGDRPQQAIPNLKQMALKANSPSQRDALKNAILTGMLSGVFYNMSQDDKKFVQRISRSIGFLPGILIRDPNHHQKIARIIEIATGEKITYGGKPYNSDIFGFGKMESLWQIKWFVDYDKWIPKWFLWNGKNGKHRLDVISDFLGRKENAEKKTLIQILKDEKTSNTDKALLQEFYNRALEKNENLDTDIHDNGKVLEQNILTKNQSHISRIIDFDGWGFKGKDEDERQNKADARSAIARTIPRKNFTDKDEVISYIELFMNRFEDRWFSTEEKRKLIRILTTIKQHGINENTETILWYTIVGNIVKNSWHGQPPKELINGLEAFKDFFKNNLEMIIQPDVIEKGFGDKMFVEELSKKPFKIAERGEYVDLKLNRQHMVGLSREQNQTRTEKRRLYEADEIYINSDMYTLAEQLHNKNDIPNKFKKYYDPEKIKRESTKEQIQDVLKPNSIKIKNPEVINKIKKKLSGELSQQGWLTDEQIAELEYLDEENY